MEPNYTTRILNYAVQTCGFYPLRPFQLALFDLQLNKAKSTMLNMSCLVKLDNSIDLERLAKAINDAVNNYDILHCRFMFHPGTNDLCQRFDGEIFPVKIEKISDEEFEIRRKNLIEPYQLVDAPLYRTKLFETPTAKYFYADFHHSITDGIGVAVVLIYEIDLRYQGKIPKRTPLQYSDLISQELLTSPEELVEGNNYWREMFKGFDEKKHLPPADVEKTDFAREEIVYYVFKNITSKYFKGKSRNENNFFLAANMIAMAKSSNSKKVIISWLHSGRNTRQEYRILGMMIEQYPISWDFDENMTVGEFLDGLDEKINFGMKYRRSLSAFYSESMFADCVTFIFQKGVVNLHENNIVIGGKPTEYIELPAEESYPRDNSLTFEFHAENSGIYSLEIAYVTTKYSEKFMQNFAESIDEIILNLKDENKKLGEIL